ncbi:MAG: hypothetical protein ACE5K8_05835 [Candidatus Zixiibacteriota bacterium]
MGKKKTFADKARKAAERQEKTAVEYVKWVRAYRAENGAWKFRTVNIAVTDENKKEIYG